MKNRLRHFLMLLIFGSIAMSVSAWTGMDMKVLRVDGRYLKDDAGNIVNLHGFAQTYSPWFNERGTKWTNYDVEGCLKYNQTKIDELLGAGWKMNFIRLHMDPYWSNTPGVSTTGENDISAFDFNRFKTYLDKVFIPMAEYAISKGLYVVMRPPGVCPETIEIGDNYHKYLKRVWGYVSTHAKLKDNPHIMFELANEPVNIKGADGKVGSDTDGCFKNLTLFFQEIVDLMRGNGCQNILWIPGTGYQSHYEGFAKYPIKGDNIGYAVHVYPGWYGSDAIEPSHELGGSYGGGFDSFLAGWKIQIMPAAEIAPIMVTEMDWAPSKYESSWGKSITGKMLGEGFGANFKFIADYTGNVSWLTFTGCELLAAFKNTPGSQGSYTFLTDPEACPWPLYHWFKDYAGESLGSNYKVKLYFSKPNIEEGRDCMIMPGSSVSAAIIADYSDGFQMNLPDKPEVAISDPSIISWDGCSFTALAPGSADVTITSTGSDGTQSKTIKFVSTYFPFVNGYFNPNIWEKGSFDQATHTIQTGTYGFAGWKYGNGVDLSAYHYLIAEMEGENRAQVSFRIFDINNYWTDPAMADFGNKTRAVFDLTNLKSNDGRKLDPSHIYIIGFWSLGNAPFKISKVYLSDNPDGESGLDNIIISDEAEFIDVYDLYGRKLRSRVARENALDGLPAGIYIAGGKKVYVGK